MKWMTALAAALVVLVMFCTMGCGGSRTKNASQILSAVYGEYDEACTVDTDADNGEHNRVAMAAKRYWTVTCTDSTGLVGAACECIQGTSTIDASAVNGLPIFANQSYMMYQVSGNTHISCDPAADDSQIWICPAG